MTSHDVLSDRKLNRATLARQLLLERSTTRPLAAVHHLVGMQAQVPLNPYLGLWSRLEGFDPRDLAQLVLDRAVVRIVTMRGTLHLVTADDCLILRPLAQPVLDRELATHRDFAPVLRGVDLAPVLEFARRMLAEPRTQRELRDAFAAQFPDLDPGALTFACRNRLALVQAPPRGVWGQAAQIRSTTAEAYLGRHLVAKPSIDEVVLRYFAAFGPASVADLAAWSRLTGLREVVDRVEAQLLTFRDERGRELYDTPDAPRPDPDTPAPPRFLPEYDNALLSHADRSRFGSDEHRAALFTGTRPVRGTVLVDGQVRATWAIEVERDLDTARLRVHAAGRLTKRDEAALVAEGRRMARFHEPTVSDHTVDLVALDGNAGSNGPRPGRKAS